jgi:hypothetical protein
MNWRFQSTTKVSRNGFADDRWKDARFQWYRKCAAASAKVYFLGHRSTSAPIRLVTTFRTYLQLTPLCSTEGPSLRPDLPIPQRCGEWRQGWPQGHRSARRAASLRATRRNATVWKGRGSINSLWLFEAAAWKQRRKVRSVEQDRSVPRSAETWPSGNFWTLLPGNYSTLIDNQRRSLHQTVVFCVPTTPASIELSGTDSCFLRPR